MNVQGMRVLITGASRGLGRSLAVQFTAAGAVVALVARSEGPLKDLALELSGTAHVADLTDREEVAALIERVENDGGPVDILVNNAGVDMTGHLADQLPGDLDALFQLNLVTPVQLTRQVVPGMLRRGAGHIVNVSSLAGVCPFPGFGAYSAAKAGLTQFSASLRADLRGLPVGVTVAELGTIRTEMLENVYRYEPTRQCFRRLERLRLSVDVNEVRAARAIVDAVSHGRRHVRLPRRAAGLAVLAEMPRRMVELVFSGVPHQEVR